LGIAVAPPRAAKGDEPLNIDPISKAKSKTWFLNGDVVRMIHTSRSAGIITLYNKTKDCSMTMSLLEFKKKRKRAFTVKEAALLLNFHPKSLPRLVKTGMLPEPIGSLPGGARAFHHASYYEEDTIIEARNIMSKVHQGKARKDGLITNNKTPTEQELRYAMGDGILVYTKDSSGRFIPIFSETI
jgi:hypothetical protein